MIFMSFRGPEALNDNLDSLSKIAGVAQVAFAWTREPKGGFCEERRLAQAQLLVAPN